VEVVVAEVLAQVLVAAAAALAAHIQGLFIRPPI
jgi:hypothetical protein